MTAKYAGRKPIAWGTKLPGICTQLPTHDKVIALTFDACGKSHRSRGYDAALIDYLRKERIPATLFFTGRWIDANPEIARKLAAEPLFEIENHGLNHRPCSVNGRSAYHIRGTRSVAEIVDEVEGNALRIQTLTHRKPKFYRCGTAMYDDVAVQVVHSLGYRIAGFTIAGDAGATYNAKQMKTAIMRAHPGSIILCHMNHPEGHTAEGIKVVVPLLKNAGFRFVKLANARENDE
jgi:peptidoglycan/xylan/chitin deacetylase (PgdA/CDA1 family)